MSASLYHSSSDISGAVFRLFQAGGALVNVLDIGIDRQIEIIKLAACERWSETWRFLKAMINKPFEVLAG